MTKLQVIIALCVVACVLAFMLATGHVDAGLSLPDIKKRLSDRATNSKRDCDIYCKSVGSSGGTYRAGTSPRDSTCYCNLSLRGF